MTTKDKLIKLFINVCNNNSVKKTEHNMFDNFPNFKIVGYNDGRYIIYQTLQEKISELEYNKLTTLHKTKMDEYYINEVENLLFAYKKNEEETEKPQYVDFNTFLKETLKTN